MHPTTDRFSIANTILFERSCNICKDYEIGAAVGKCNSFHLGGTILQITPVPDSCCKGIGIANQYTVGKPSSIIFKPALFSCNRDKIRGGPIIISTFSDFFLAIRSTKLRNPVGLINFC